ncbi:MAG: MerR family transcriptional regulator [Calditrichaeota bacterium]|nr:MerR family transcriptional regulator [Calditrichota bacterium]RQW08344.1 MAG: MerR family transcriptional regulator [Calditrichota bacterium]
MRIQKPKQKMVYSLREVCRLTGLSDSVLKRWEVEFPQLKPVRNRAANRSYLQRDLKLIFFLRDLIYVHKLDEQGVRERLKSYNTAKDQDSPSYLKSVLSEVRMEVEEIRELLEQ